MRTLATAEDVFDLCARLLKPVPDGAVARYRVSGGRRRFSVRGLFQEYPDDVWDENALFAAQTQLENALAGLVNVLHALRDTLADAAPDGAFNPCADLAAQLDGIAESFVAFANEANFVLKGEEETHAYWVERVRLEKRRTHLRLVAAPLSVAGELSRVLYEAKDSVVLSSATLRVGSDFRYAARRLGFRYAAGAGDSGRFKALVAASPFDYLRQSLVLFTSYEMMNRVAECAHAPLVAAGIRLLVQGEGLSREAMTARLKRLDGEPTVLFGAQSFWEGVDVAGEALSCVVIARLPFLMVGDPIVEARSEAIDRNGGSAFRDYALPEAVIRFRQGFGRLIRSKRDRGVVVVTDPRLVTKNYGGSFRRSIPASVHTVTARDELLARVADFFS